MRSIVDGLFGRKGKADRQVHRVPMKVDGLAVGEIVVISSSRLTMLSNGELGVIARWMKVWWN